MLRNIILSKLFRPEYGDFTMPKITIIESNIEFNTDEAESILDAAIENGVEIESDCGGNAVCGLCHIYVEEGDDLVSEMTPDEEEMLCDLDDRKENSRLACQVHVYGNIKVSIPPVQ